MRIICTVINDLSQDQRMDRICTSLARAGHDVTLVGRQLSTSLPLPERDFRQLRIPCSYTAGKMLYLEYNWRLVLNLRGRPFDAICSVDVDTLAAGAALTRHVDKLLVFDAHEWFHLTPEVVDRPLIRGFWKGLAKMLMPRTDLRYTVAPRLAGELAKDYGFPFGTVRNLPVRNKAAFNPTPDKKIILYQGMFNPGRGLEVAIAAMDGLPECELWLVGSGPEEGALRGCRANLRAPERVKFLGFVPPAELPKITRQAWLGLNLLEARSPSYYYSLANKALDYVQAGVPSVQMDFPEYRALTDRYGCYQLISELTVAALVASVSPLTRNADLYRDLKSANERAAVELCWEREEKVLLNYWSSLQKPKR
ncbi:glycosyltransferase family 4 protein [Neolewinella antarctica]|uniref:Glycosyltransferase involved in cell wall biosynthesis n=1 Tax=Neolewinella antarctica TaxID=442734 RepID=A0ABX0X6J2_9BACT|nr:glycosyltransferase family 4 protein [Neolewinella antarctica]NJC24840.1 glycosyltransferase involved in cell wall biosynthesis [Neolewinella antarctica]